MRAYLPLLLGLVASVALAQNPRDQSWSVLKEGVADNNPEKRVHAITAISSIGVENRRSVSLLEGALRDGSPIVRQTAAALLGEMRARHAIPELRKALDDDDPQVSFTAAKSLWQVGDRSGRRLFEDVLMGDQTAAPGLMEGAMRDAKAKLRNPGALAMMGVKEASGALLGPGALGIDVAREVMKDKGAPGRSQSVSLLSDSCDTEGRELMEAVVNTDRNWGVRVAAARALGHCGNGESVILLRQLLYESHDAIRMMAAASIIRLIEKNPAYGRLKASRR